MAADWGTVALAFASPGNALGFVWKYLMELVACSPHLCFLPVLRAALQNSSGCF